jgi:hypothetical protein
MINSLFYIFLLISLSSQPLPDEKAVIIEQNKFLTAMLSLAEKSKHYFIFDFAQKRLFLMNKGVLLREWTVDQVRFTGDPVPIQLFSLVGKNIQLADLRLNVNDDDESIDDSSSNKTSNDKTSDNNDDRYELDAMEIDDMPTNYRLFLNGGITINVRSQPQNLGSALKNIAHSFTWYTYYPILSIWSSLKKTTFSVIDISFKDKKEAQALFWASAEESECIFLFPESGNREAFQFLDTITETGS